MNVRLVLALARKDLKAALRNKQVVLPALFVPALFLVLIPVMAVAIASGPANENPFQDVQGLPAGDLKSLVVEFVLLRVFAPLYLLIPLLVVHVIAADSIAGERERRTLEALVYTPTTDLELFLGKAVAAWVPAVALAWGSFLVYAVTANLAALRIVGHLVFPTLAWVILAVWVAPAVALFTLGIMVMVSLRASTFQAAYQIGGLIVIPVLGIVGGQVVGAGLFSPVAVLLLGAAFWAVDVGLLALGRRAFRRGEILARLDRA